MNANKPRRPAQIEVEQLENIEGEADTAVNSELAHTTAQVVVPLGFRQAEEDPEVVERVLGVIRDEGIDVLAESWVRSPEESLPGILWRGFLLREWIRRFPEEAHARFEASKAVTEDAERIDATPSPADVLAEWNKVFEGDYKGEFADVLRDSARLTNFLGSVEPVWIADDEHPLATSVTRRDTALLSTSVEFRNAGELLERGTLD